MLNILTLLGVIITVLGIAFIVIFLLVHSIKNQHLNTKQTENQAKTEIKKTRGRKKKGE